MKYLFLIAAALAVFAGAGCYLRQFENVEKARALRVGMTKEQVLEIMGEPEEDVLYASPDQWFYFTRSRWHDGQVTEDECLPVIFENDRVVGWGNVFFGNYRLEERHLYRPDEESGVDDDEAADAAEPVAVEVEAADAAEPVAVEVEAADAAEPVAVEVEAADAAEPVAVEVEADGAPEDDRL